MSSVEERCELAMHELISTLKKERKEKEALLKERNGLIAENQALKNEIREYQGIYSVNDDAILIARDVISEDDEKKEDIHTGIPVVSYPKGNHVLKGHSDQVLAAVVSCDGRYLYTGSADKSIIKWNMTSNTLIKQWSAHTKAVSSLAYHHSGLLVSGSVSRFLKIWDANENEQLKHTLMGHTSFVNSVALNKPGTLIASASYDETIRVWCVETVKCIKVFNGHTREVKSVQWIDQIIISGARDSSLKIWDTGKGKLIRTITDGISNAIYDLSVNCNESLVACIFQSGFTVYNWPKMDIVRTVQMASPRGCFHPLNPDVLAVNDREVHSIKIYQISSGKCVRSFNGHLRSVEDICFNPNGSRLISASADKTTRIWDMSDI